METLPEYVVQFLKNIEQNGDVIVLNIENNTYKQIKQFNEKPVVFRVELDTVWEHENGAAEWETLIKLSSSADCQLFVEYSYKKNDEIRKVGKYIDSISSFRTFIEKIISKYEKLDDYEDIAEELQESLI